MCAVDSMADATNREESVDVIYTDFKSAFETMPQDLLISVLPSMGIGGRSHGGSPSF